MEYAVIILLSGAMFFVASLVLIAAFLVALATSIGVIGFLL